MFEPKKNISKEEADKKRLENKVNFVLWLEKMNNQYLANAPRMQRAIDNIL